MKNITRDMIKTYRINKLKYDFMGYTFNCYEELSFHHLIIPKRDSLKAGIGDGYLIWNGSILRQDTSHDYLHIIEQIDREIFLVITDAMIRENQLGKLDIEDFNFLDIKHIIPENNIYEIKKFNANKKYYQDYEETLFI